ncbi:MAG: hypothetical protein LUE93_03945 [Bacteroides sp.]|nr:hypothetical protein [Bacteroides sp.]
MFEEIEEHRNIYRSTEGCSKITLVNTTSESVWKPTGYVFKDVVTCSEFESNDYGAFEWMPEEEVMLNIPDLLIDNQYYAINNACVYKKGAVKTPYMKDIENGSAILVHPYTTLYLSGEMGYCKRVYHYTLTIENTGTGNRFEVSGIWRQTIPFTPHIISSDKP